MAHVRDKTRLLNRVRRIRGNSMQWNGRRSGHDCTKTLHTIAASHGAMRA